MSELAKLSKDIYQGFTMVIIVVATLSRVIVMRISCILKPKFITTIHSIKFWFMRSYRDKFRYT